MVWLLPTVGYNIFAIGSSYCGLDFVKDRASELKDKPKFQSVSSTKGLRQDIVVVVLSEDFSKASDDEEDGWELKFQHYFLRSSSTNYIGSNIGLQPPRILVREKDYFQNGDACLFMLKREVAHIRNNDAIFSKVIFAISSIASTIIFYPLTSYVVSWIVACIVVGVADAIFSNCSERKADTFAIQHATDEELEKGKEFFASQQKENLKLREKKVVVVDAKGSGNIEHFFQQLSQFWTKIRFSSDGDDRLNFWQPRLSGRIAKITREIERRNS